MRILLISFYFPPFNNIGAVRASKMAKYFHRHGHDLRVVSAENQLMPATLELEIPKELVAYTPWRNVRRPAEWLVGAGREGTSQSAGLGHKAPRRRLVSALWDLYRTLLYVPDMQIGWYSFAAAECLRIAETWKPDIIYASAVPFTSLLVARKVARRLNVPWVAEMRDLWTQSHFYSYPGWRKWLETKLERRVLGSAAGLVTVSEPLSKMLLERYRQPVAVVTNGFDPSDFTFPEPQSSPGELRIVYTGGLHACKYDLTPLWDALNNLGDARRSVRLIFYGKPADLEIAKAAAAQHGAEENIELRGLVPYREAVRAQVEADVLLFLIWEQGKLGEGVFSGKFFEYLGARRPILAIGGSDNVAARVIIDKQAGIVTENPERIAGQLSAWLEMKKNSGIPPVSAEAGAEFTREAQARKAEEFMERLLSPEPTRIAAERSV
ncbi:MAG TPA: glycosyltransferase [Planctomycetota bacterium]|jgi:glycosyltransferase involved in cell wall biosynthesis